MEDSKFVGGAYHGYRVSVRLIREGAEQYRPYRITGPTEVYDFFKELSAMDRETFYCVHLDQRNQVISCEEVSRGSLSASIVHPREVYKGAILSSAASIIVVHNHPSGDPTPSAEDHGIVDRLVSAGELLGIPLLDSIIIGTEGRYCSIQEHLAYGPRQKV